MATTALVFETIIIGFQVIVWLLLLLSIPGFGWLDVFNTQFEDWAIIGSAVFIGLSYVLGAMFSQLSAEALLHFPPAKKLVEKMLKERDLEDAVTMRVYIWTKDPHTANHLEVWGRKCALLRATCLNVPFICIFGSILALKVQGFLWSLLIVYGLVSTAIVVFSFWAWIQSIRDYLDYFGAAYDRLKEMPGS